MSAAEAATTNRTTVSIGTKLTLATLAVLVVVSTLLYRELTRRERQNLVAAKETAASMVADLFAASLAAPLDFADQDAVHTEIEHLETNTEVICAAVFSKDSPTPVAEVKRGCDASRPVTPADSAGAVRHEDRVEVARVVFGREKARVGTARIVFSLARENAAYAASRARIFWLSFLLAVGTAAVLTAISRTQIVRPLHRLGEAAARVGRGDFSTEVVVSSRDELGQLATAFNRMREEIADRERRLAAVTQNLRELFDHMGQAIVAFDRTGKVRGEVSREATNIFGAPERDKGLEGRSIGALLFGEGAFDVEAQAFDEWRAMAFDVASSDWNQLAVLAPQEVTVRNPSGLSVPLELEFRPVTKDGALDRVMLLASDVSEKKRLELAIDVQEEGHKKRMAAMRRLVAGGAQLFVQFIEGARARLETAPAPIRHGRIDREALTELFRHVHTLKGEARAFELGELAEALESVEDTLAAVRSSTDGEVAGLEAKLERARDAIDHARTDFVTASPIGDAALEQITVRRSDLQAVLSIARGRDPVLAQAAARLASRPFGESMTTLVARATEWAARDGKRIELVVEGREVRVPPRLAEVLGGVMTHLLRNAIAHGIEAPDERAARAKDEAGTIWASAQEGTHSLGPSIIVEDDGRGIDAEAVVERARAMGMRVGDGPAEAASDPLELVFMEGISTRQSADGLSGRGVGLDAVRAYLRGAGYRIQLVSESGRGTKFVIEPDRASFSAS